MDIINPPNNMIITAKGYFLWESWKLVTLLRNAILSH